MFLNFIRNYTLYIGIILLGVQLLPNAQAIEAEPHYFEKKEAVSNQQCTTCHQQQTHDWQASDHAKAMSVANKETILADFNHVNVEHYGQKAFFFIKNNQYQVTISYDSNVDTYPIKYTFGHYPLQQYLVEVETGKLQVLPFAWDSREKADGGQRWFHNYSQEEISPEDRLHWRQPLQNWNGMCADCHSDGLKRNYNVDNNSFSSTWDNINVGCLSCHGNMTHHENKSPKRNISHDILSKNHPTGQWLRTLGEKTASWQGEKRDNSFMDTCFACHSLRTPLTDGIDPEKPFLHQFTPQLLAAPMYYADGQIKEEVYVYGSFLQSKMYAAGVNCLDCHDKHTMKLKVEGNGLCLQCHGSEVYNVKEHHQHSDDSTGAQCVNCHMPTKRYMGVDDRRDHSFKIPRPDVSEAFKTPNACTNCHEGKSNQWASDNLIKWHGEPKTISNSKVSLMRLNSGQPIALKDHLNIISDVQLDVISRATAIQLLPYSSQNLSADILAPYLLHKEDLIRLSAASAATLLAPIDRVKLLTPLLKDPNKAIRVNAARSLLDNKVLTANKTAFDQAFKELQHANTINSWRAEGRMNQGITAIQRGDLITAEVAFRTSINIEPYFDTGYINLADVYRSLNKPAQVSSVLLKGMNKLPKSGLMKYAYGLHLVRQKSLDKAIAFFDESLALSPDNAQYAYTYILAMDSAGHSTKALMKLKLLITTYADKQQLKELGLYLSQKLNNRIDYNYFSRF